ncbi:MAG: hypothetical protein Q9173_000444 [Seirophora scorigena]
MGEWARPLFVADASPCYRVPPTQEMEGDRLPPPLLVDQPTRGHALVPLLHLSAATASSTSILILKPVRVAHLAYQLARPSDLPVCEKSSQERAIGDQTHVLASESSGQHKLSEPWTSRYGHKNCTERIGYRLTGHKLCQ